MKHTWKQLRTLISSAAAASLLLVSLSACQSGQPAGSPAGGDSSKPSQAVTIKVSHTNAEGGGTDLAAKDFKAAVDAADASLDIQLYGNNQLGAERPVFESVLTGTVEMQIISTSVLATVIPEAYVMNVPFLFNDVNQFWEVVNTDAFYDVFSTSFEAQGLHFLGFMNCHDRAVANTVREIHTPEDMHGMKIRVLEGEVYTDLFTALGCNTSVVPITELYTSLSQGMVEGEDLGIAYLVPNKYVEVEKYYTDTNHTMQPLAAIVNLSVWNKLSADQQKALEDAVKAAGDGARDRYSSLLEEYYATAENDYGMVITHLTDEERQAFKDATADVSEKYANLNEGCRATYDVIQEIITGGK